MKVKQIKLSGLPLRRKVRCTVFQQTDDDEDDAQPVSIAITIPPEIQGGSTTPAVAPAVALSAQNVSVIARGRVLPSGSLSVGLIPNR